MKIRSKGINAFFLAIVWLSLGGQYIHAQGNQLQPSVIFSPSLAQDYGFDAAQHREWSHKYTSLSSQSGVSGAVAFKSVGYGREDRVNAVLRMKANVRWGNLQVRYAENKKSIPFIRLNDSTLTIFLQPNKNDYRLDILYKNQLCASLNVLVFRQVDVKLIVVPLVPNAVKQEDIQSGLNRIYAQANLFWNVEMKPVFYPNGVKNSQRLANPSVFHDRYTSEMQEIRDHWFETFPNADRNAMYLFLVPGFVNPEIMAYQVKNKALGFAVVTAKDVLIRNIACELARGYGMLDDSWSENGPKKNSTENLMDQGSGTSLTAWQWKMLQHSAKSYSYYDDYEDVVSNSGRVAALFWEEDEQGYIYLKNENPLSALRRPFKRNYLAYEKDINSWFYLHWFRILGHGFAPIHLLAFLLLIGLYILVHRAFFNWKARYKLPFRFMDLFLGMIAMSVLLGCCMLCYILINQTYDRFYIKEGNVPAFKNKPIGYVINRCKQNRNMKNSPTYHSCTEIIKRKKQNWYFSSQQRVLYFEYEPTKGKWGALRLVKASDRLELKTHLYEGKVSGHYIVISSPDKKDGSKTERVFNHMGVELTHKLKLADPPKRVLLFINGYRATTRGHNFEEFFADIRKFGLEHPNSENLIYNFDRFDYWRPWNEIDLKFQRRINPTDVFYADGHFSVTTSNHRTLLNFSTTSGMYPKRCQNPRRHVCYRTNIASTRFIGQKNKSTYAFLPLRSNKAGFRMRVRNGKMAGKNLLQLLNEVPNYSRNDTLFVVAHSMGYAYALGMLEELRGHIHFGGFYIMAPENAVGGKVNPKEWMEVWQYGSNLNNGKKDAPCLQDGIAPQSKAGGLSDNQRVYIPRNQYRKKGFFDSHFVGFYDWIFDIPKGKKGYIHQR